MKTLDQLDPLPLPGERKPPETVSVTIPTVPGTRVFLNGKDVTDLAWAFPIHWYAKETL